MATVDLLPNGNGYSIQWVLSAGTRPSCLWTNDGATSYISKDTASVGIDSYTLDDMPAGAVSINSVVVYAYVGRSATGPGNGNIGVRYNSTNLFSSAAIFPGSWNQWTYTAANAPGGGAWTPTILNSTEVMVRAQGDGTSGVSAYCTQLYVHVDYVPGGSMFMIIMSLLGPLIGSCLTWPQFCRALDLLERRYRFTREERLEMYRKLREWKRPSYAF